MTEFVPKPMRYRAFHDVERQHFRIRDTKTGAAFMQFDTQHNANKCADGMNAKELAKNARRHRMPRRTVDAPPPRAYKDD